MSESLSNQVALVTGASRGIGRAIAQRLATDGAAVIVNYAKNAAEASQTVEAITAAGGKAVAVQADVSQSDDVARLFDAAYEEFGRLDVLVNNAGIVSYSAIAETEEEEFDRVMAVNVKGTFLCCREAARRMQSGGRIINLSSSTTVMMLPNYGNYVASKGAVEQLSRSLAKELGPKGIAVNVVSPGPTDTELFFRGKSEEQVRFLTNLAAFGRLAQPEDIANVVAMMVSPDAAWVTGQNLRANGGTV